MYNVHVQGNCKESVFQELRIKKEILNKGSSSSWGFLHNFKFQTKSVLIKF